MYTSDRIHVGEIQCGTRTRSATLDIAAMRLDTTNTRWVPARLDQHGLTTLKPPSDQRARYYGSGPGQREHTIDRESRLPDIAWRRRCGQLPRESGFQGLESLSRDD
jgi:hypothetical protein